MFDELDIQAENEFKIKCEEIAMHQPVVRATLDGEWDEDELKSDIYDVCVEVMTSQLLKKYENKALKNRNLLLVDYMAETISNSIEDVIELYNTEYDKHRNENKFGIIWYDEAITRIINRKLKENAVI